MTDREIIDACYTNVDYEQLSNLERIILVQYANDENLYYTEITDDESIPNDLLLMEY